jgi:hypothetical protein
VFLGAEGKAEAPPGWVREVTDEEARELQREAHPWPGAMMEGGTRSTLGELLIDGTSRPYWLVEVTDEAPGALRFRLANRVRCLRLED